MVVLGMQQKPTDVLSRNELIEEKIDACWCINKYAQGTANMYKIAEYLYFSLYEPDNPTVPLIEYFPGCILRFQQRLFFSASPPPKEIFIETIRQVMVHDIDYAACLYDNSLVNLHELFHHGRVTIWTSGDMDGFPEKSIPGSRQQLHKIKAAGIEVIANDIAIQKNRPLSQLFSIAAHEDKLTVVNQIFRDIKKRGAQMAIIVDDQLHNLLEARQAASSVNLKTTLCWINSANDDNTSSEHAMIFRSFGAAVNYITSLDDRLSCEFLVDFDGVISDDEKRAVLHKRAIIKNLERNNWI